MRGINKQTMLDLIIEAKRNDPETGSFAEWLAEYLAEHMPTLTPPNEWVNRVRELDELYTKLQIVTGFTAEQLLEIFSAGYTLEKPDYSKKFAEMENLAEAAQPNEPLTMEELRESPHGKIKNSTLQSICNRANEIASRPPEVSP